MNYVKVTKGDVVSYVEVPTKETIIPESIDVEFASSLYKGDSKTQAKLDLEEYGKRFGIDLNRNKTFDNMMKDLHKHLEE